MENVWLADGRPYVRCAKPRREDLKSVRPCGQRHELDVQTLIRTRGTAFPISMLSERMKCPGVPDQRVVVTLSLPGSVVAAAKAGSL
jgi:hypothetical protein